MPGPVRQLTVEEARDHIKGCSFRSPAPDLVGLETEWLVVDPDDGGRRVPFRRLCAAMAAAGRLPGGSAVTYEPGGQLELSGPPAPGVGAACEAMAADVAFARRIVDRQGLRLTGEGHDPKRQPNRVVDTPRYRAMETYFGADGHDGSRMMSATAALQINVGPGRRSAARARWTRANALGPALVAAFANSPLAGGRPTGWKSWRLATWRAIDPTRTAPVGVDAGPAGWADYALGARVMFIRVEDSHYRPLAEPLSFEAWLEIRYLDALPDPWWRVAATVVATLLIDERAGARAGLAATGTEALWVEAARSGLEHPELASAARACFDATLDAGPRAAADPASLKLTAEYLDRYVAQGRCPADDRLREVAWSSKSASNGS